MCGGVFVLVGCLRLTVMRGYVCVDARESERDVWLLVKSYVCKRVNSGKCELGDLYQQSL